MGRCKIFCADQMIVGRWYKLITHAVGHDVPYNYTVNYSTDAENVVLLHDTLYVKSVGDFTVSCVDMYGNTDSKTITAIEKPTIERTEHTITPTDWADFQTQVTAIGENALILIPTGEYAFDLTAEAYTLPAGVIVDFQGSTVKITSSVSTYYGFRIAHDFCGIKNANFVGDMLNDESYVNLSTLLSLYSGDYAEIENLTFDGLAGFNFALGGGGSFWSYQPSHKASRWTEDDLMNGYISDDGTVVESAEAWTMTEPAEIVTTADRSYYVGRFNGWIPSTVRVYDIAFYDTDGNLLELKKDQQYYRKAYYPEGAAYVRYCIWQEAAPATSNAGDDPCIMRMKGAPEGFETTPSVREAWISNIVYKNHASGGISIVGQCEDVHIDKMLAKGNGWSNGWAFDAEDGWNAMLGVVVTHSYFAYGHVVLHGCQGVSLLSTICGGVTLNSNVHFPTIVNCLCGTLYSYGTRGCATVINSYLNRVEDTEENGAVYTFSERTQKEMQYIRNKVAKYI